MDVPVTQAVETRSAVPSDRDLISGASGPVTSFDRRNVIIVNQNSTRVLTGNGTVTLTYNVSGAISLTTLNVTMTSGAPDIVVNVDPSPGNGSLKYLYLIFLIVAALIVVAVLRVVFVKRRRQAREAKTEYIRRAALRQDLERTRSHGSEGSGVSNGSLRESIDSMAAPITRERERTSLHEPPPPYPAHLRLPSYEP